MDTDTSKLQASRPSHHDIMTMDYGPGGKLVCRFNDPFNKGSHGGQWCPIAYAPLSQVKNIEALELVRIEHAWRHELY